MARALSESDLNILEGYVTEGDRSGYYNQLASWGYTYALLAGGVVNSSPATGSVANIHLAESASLQGQIIDPIEAVDISESLMRADYTARSASASSSRTGNELSVDVIEGYHYKVFEDFGLNKYSWTASAPLEMHQKYYKYFGYDSPQEAKAAAWEAMMTGGYAGQIAIYIKMQTLAYPHQSQLNTTVPLERGDPTAKAWFDSINNAMTDEGLYMFTGYGTPYPPDNCFTVGTEIALADGTCKVIEDIQVGDLVLSYDATGNLVPGRVVRTFQNEAKHILDFFGLMVTPGHVMMCGAGRYAGRHVTLLDILRSDGAVVTADGKIIRAATGVEVDSEMDAEIEVVIARQGAKGFEVAQSGRLRMGTRVLLEDGTDISLAELIAANGGQRTDAGLIAGPQGEAPLMWPFGDQLPAPEDYILARSAVTLADIYAANEWESAPSMHAPVLGDVGPMIPASDRVRDQMPANIPLSMRPRSIRALQ